MWVIVESVSPRISGLYDLERDGGPATFSELAQKAGSLARGPDSWPTTKSVYQAANPVDRAVRRNLRTHAHTRMRAGRLQHSKSNILRFIKRESSQSRENPQRQTDTGGAEHPPALEEIKLLRVVYATRKGTGISCAPPKPSPPIPLPPQSPPECPTSIKCLRGLMESVPVLQPRSPRDVAPRRAVTALRLRNARKRKGLVPLPRSRLPVTRVRARAQGWGQTQGTRVEGGALYHPRSYRSPSRHPSPLRISRFIGFSFLQDTYHAGHAAHM
jgi:hypothetical protein